MKHFCSFSEAIRAGIPLKPQGSGGLLKDGRTCAIGAGLDAMGQLPQMVLSTLKELLLYRVAEDSFPYLTERADCDQGCGDECANQSITNLLWHLNDQHAFDREHVADWLEKYEESIGFVHLVESEPNASRAELSLNQQPMSARASV